jgi:HEAT repeat protein
MNTVCRACIWVALIVVLPPQAWASDESVDALIQAIEDADQRDSTRALSIRKLAKYKEKAEPAIPALKRIVAAREYETTEMLPASIDCLREIGKAGVPALAEAVMLDSPRPKLAAAALARIGPKARAAVPKLLAYLRAHDATRHSTEYQFVLRHTIQLRPDPAEFVPLLTKLARHSTDLMVARRIPGSESAVSATAIGGLAQYGSAAKGAVPTLIYVIQFSPRVGTDSPSLIRASMACLAGIGKDAAPALPVLRLFLKDKYFADAAENAITSIKAGVSAPPRRGK